MDENDSSALSRRRVVGAVGIGMAVSAAAPAFAQNRDQSTSTNRSSEPVMDDPRSKYPKPPFKQQTQPWPGLARDMDPKPDHGETSYRGAGRLAGRKALITGGDSGMGRAAAIAYAREGADVAINYFPSEEPDARDVMQLIKEAGRKGLAIPGDLRDEAFCQKLVADTVQGLGGLDIVVCNAGRQQSKPSILDITTAEFDATMKTNIYAPFWIIKAALPHLKPGACIIGTTSEQAYDPSRRGRYGRRCRSAAARRRRSTRNSAAPRPLAGRGSLPSSPRFMSSSRPPTRVSPPETLTAPAADKGSP